MQQCNWEKTASNKVPVVRKTVYRYHVVGSNNTSNRNYATNACICSQAGQQMRCEQQLSTGTFQLKFWSRLARQMQSIQAWGQCINMLKFVSLVPEVSNTIINKFSYIYHCTYIKEIQLKCLP
jgi:hypothetical protein